MIEWTMINPYTGILCSYKNKNYESISSNCGGVMPRIYHKVKEAMFKKVSRGCYIECKQWGHSKKHMYLLICAKEIPEG